MSKLYIFGIGGTGSRVLKALTMLMSAGVQVKDSNGALVDIVPIIIDPDHAAGDLTRTHQLMRDYKALRDKLDFAEHNKNQFFSNRLLLDVISGDQSDNIVMNLGNTQNIDFKTYIGLANMDASNEALAQLLFSEDNLNAMMDVGFKGNPNIGSIVLNQFQASAEFKSFVADFKADDRIFIISSIFGGTGASGFPLLIKNLRNVSHDISGHALVKSAPMGAISVLPYFNVSQTEGHSKIDSATFLSKSKAALSYYNENLTEANVIYTIGETPQNLYTNNEGGSSQQNDAHFIELASALAIVDFARLPNIPSDQTDYKEFGVLHAANPLTFPSLDAKTNEIVERPMIQFALLCKYLNDQIDKSKKQPWFKENDINISSLFINIKDAYYTWLNEMAKNQRAFKPIDLNLPIKQLFSMVEGVIQREKPLRDDAAWMDNVLNKLTLRKRLVGTDEQKVAELFFRATALLIEKKFKLK